MKLRLENFKLYILFKQKKIHSWYNEIQIDECDDCAKFTIRTNIVLKKSRFF